jgi:hypothetical protein
MEIETYIDWVKDVNLAASKINKCLSCFDLNSSILKTYYEEGIPPTFTVVRLTLDERQKNKCICKEKSLK